MGVLGGGVIMDEHPCPFAESLKKFVFGVSHRLLDFENRDEFLHRRSPEIGNLEVSASCTVLPQALQEYLAHIPCERGTLTVFMREVPL